MKAWNTKYSTYQKDYSKPNPSKEDIISNMIIEWIESRKNGLDLKQLNELSKNINSYLVENQITNERVLMKWKLVSK